MKIFLGPLGAILKTETSHHMSRISVFCVWGDFFGTWRNLAFKKLMYLFELIYYITYVQQENLLQPYSKLSDNNK